MNQAYQKEYKTAKIIIWFTLFAMLFSALGIFALSLHESHHRIKEIGIRKVNWVKVRQILTMLNVDYVKWVVIAFIFACPIAWYAISRWLENFAYKADISWWIFALAGSIALIIALFTVSWQSWRAARRNPVEALKYE